MSVQVAVKVTKNWLEYGQTHIKHSVQYLVSRTFNILLMQNDQHKKYVVYERENKLMILVH